MSILRNISVRKLDFSLERKNILNIRHFKFQYLLAQPLALITETHRLCMEFTKFLHVLGLVASHSRITTLLRWFFDLILTLWTPLFKMAHKCSIGLRSGDWVGIFNRLGCSILTIACSTQLCVCYCFPVGTYKHMVFPS